MELTCKQALLAAYTLLDDLHDQSKSDTLMALLRDMNPFVFTDRTPADPATWSEWLTCAKAIQGDDNLTENTAFQTLLSFLRYNEKQYGYHTDSILIELQTPVYQKRWHQLVEKASSLADVE